MCLPNLMTDQVRVSAAVLDTPGVWPKGIDGQVRYLMTLNFPFGLPLPLDEGGRFGLFIVNDFTYIQSEKPTNIRVHDSPIVGVLSCAVWT